jgi:hypothetical protein
MLSKSSFLLTKYGQIVLVLYTGRMNNVKKVSFLRGRVITGIVVIFFLATSTSIANADHSWSTYHWARTSNAFTLQLGDNLTSNWDPFLVTTSTDWSTSAVLDTRITPGTNLRKCGAVLGRVEVCNDRYGNNGWLGVAQVWLSGGHISQGTVKVNDTYFNTTRYNTTAWKNLVMCQEVGHTFGLDHQDENQTNANLGTCMDYTNLPNTNQYANSHDFEQLESIYLHRDTSTTIRSTTTSVGKNPIANLDDPSSWGKPAGPKDSRGRSSHFELDLGNGQKVFTFVVWADN